MLYEAGASEEVVTAIVDFDAVALVRERGAFGLNRMLEQLDRHGSELDLPDVRRPLPAASGQPARLSQQLERLVVRKRLDDAAVASGHVLRRPERVDDGFLGRVDGRLEQRIQLVVADGALVAGRERDEDLAAAVVGDRARARQPEARAAGDPLQLVRRELRVGREDDDAASGLVRRRSRARACGAPERRRSAGCRRSSSARALRAWRRAGARRGSRSRCRPCSRGRTSPFRLRRRPARSRCRRCRHGLLHVGCLDVHDPSVAQPAVVAFADDRDHDVVRCRRSRPPRPRSRRRRPSPGPPRASTSDRPASRGFPIRGSGSSRSARLRRSAPPSPREPGARGARRRPWAGSR